MALKKAAEQAPTDNLMASSAVAQGAGQLTQQGLEAMFPTPRPQQPTLPPTGPGIPLASPSQPAPGTDWTAVLTGMVNTIAAVATAVFTAPVLTPAGGIALGAGVGKSLEVAEQKLDIGQPAPMAAQKPAQPMGQGQSMGRAKQLAQEHGARYNELATAAFTQGAQGAQRGQAQAAQQPTISYSDAIGNLV